MVNVEMLISPGNEVHTFEPTPQDIINISKCDLFIYNGAESDEWVNTVLEGLGKEIKTVKMMDFVEFDTDHIHDEHIWTSPENALKIAEGIAEKLCDIDSENKEYYQQNLNDYKAELTKLDETFREIVGGSKRNVMIFADRFPMKHFVESYGLDYYSVYPGCAEDTEPSAAAVSTAIDKVKAENIPVVFKIELSNDNIAKTVSEATDAEIKTFHTCHNLSVEDFESGETYLTLMNKNAKVLEEALN